VGIVLIVVAVNLPYVGWLINLLLTLVGLGALLLTAHGAFRLRQSELAV
jgi:hypothetical protein